MNSVKGKEATADRILEVYKALDMFKYEFIQCTKQQEGLTPEQVDQKIVELSLSEEHRSGIIHKVKSE